MKFEKFLNEETLEDIKEAAKMVARDSKPYIKENIVKIYTGSAAFKVDGILYRGYKGRPDPILKVTPRGNRKPVDIPIDIHKRLDVLFKEKFGWKVRSEGVFTSGESIVASAYGSGAYIVFPIGKYKYVWSPKVYDMWESLKDHHGLVAGNPSDMGGTAQSLYVPGLTTHEKSLKTIVNSYTDKNLAKGIKKGGEITLKVGSYYLLDRNNMGTFLKELGKLI
jgi:hypothetical protein